MKRELHLPLLAALAVLQASALAAAPPAPPPGTPVAWIRFDRAGQRYADTPYVFLGDGDIALAFDVRLQAGHALDLLWGAKRDARGAALTVNGKTVRLEQGGYDGFRWLRAPLPEGAAAGERCEVRLAAAAGQAKAAFLAEVRLTATAASGPASGVPAPAATNAFRARLLAAAPRPSGTAGGEAFPAMRALWDREPPAASAGAGPDEAHFRLAERRARQAAEALYRCHRFVDGWLAHADPATGLIPRNLRESRDFWNGRDAAADNYPFMVLTAALTDRTLFAGRMLDMLRTEARLTARIDRLPDDYQFSTRTWRRAAPDLDATIFDGAEYVKDGLLPITEWLGPSPWSERAIAIVDDIWKNARIATPSGPIPTLNFEVNGDLLQAGARLFWFTGDRKYLDQAIRLGDYYLLGDHHPTRNMPELSLGDHSCEVINGLSELYVAVSRAAPEKRRAYAAPLRELYDRLLAIARNEHGLVYLRVDTRTGRPRGDALTDNWGYNYDGIYTFGLVEGIPAYREAVRQALGSLKAHYTGRGGMCQSGTADGYADSIEGAITLLNREPVESAAEWIDTEIRTMWSRQKPDGVIEGWHGDGNSARTSIMYALWKTAGARIEPWRADLRLGAARDGETVYLSLAADQPWSGRVVFDRPRHKLYMRLPLDYPRINQFPEWFAPEAEARFTLRDAAGGPERAVDGRTLWEGVPATVAAATEIRWSLAPAAKPAP